MERKRREMGGGRCEVRKEKAEAIRDGKGLEMGKL